MALKQKWKHKHKKVTLQTGYFYSFSYRAYEHDKNPNIIFINAIAGINENTGHQHRYIQGINLNYIPKKDRKKFIDDWMKYGYENKKVQFNWKLIQKKYPYIQFAIRRYFFKPNYYISNLKIIPAENITSVLLDRRTGDFSHILKQMALSKIKGLKTKKK